MDRGTAKDRTSTRRRRALAACALVLLALPGAAGCGEDGTEKAAAAARARAAAAAHGRQLALGRRLFAQHCDNCHTLAGQRYNEPIIEWEAPNLDEVRLKRSYVRYRIEVGGPAMSIFASQLPGDRLDALIAYVTETAGRNVDDDGDQPPEQVEAGREVFAEHCASCHGIEGRAMTGRPVYPGMDFNLVKPSVQFVRSRAFHGIAPPQVGLMPSFRNVLSDEQLDDVATYVNAVAAEGREEAPAGPGSAAEPPPR